MARSVLVGLFYLNGDYIRVSIQPTATGKLPEYLSYLGNKFGITTASEDGRATYEQVQEPLLRENEDEEITEEQEGELLQQVETMGGMIEEQQAIIHQLKMRITELSGVIDSLRKTLREKDGNGS